MRHNSRFGPKSLLHAQYHQWSSLLVLQAIQNSKLSLVIIINQKIVPESNCLAFTHLMKICLIVVRPGEIRSAHQVPIQPLI